MLLVRIIERKKIMLILCQVKLNKVLLCPAGLGMDLG